MHPLKGKNFKLRDCWFIQRVCTKKKKGSESSPLLLWYKTQKSLWWYKTKESLQSTSKTWCKKWAEKNKLWFLEKSRCCCSFLLYPLMRYWRCCEETFSSIPGKKRKKTNLRALFFELLDLLTVLSFSFLKFSFSVFFLFDSVKVIELLSCCHGFHNRVS